MIPCAQVSRVPNCNQNWAAYFCRTETELGQKCASSFWSWTPTGAERWNRAELVRPASQNGSKQTEKFVPNRSGNHFQQNLELNKPTVLNRFRGWVWKWRINSCHSRAIRCFARSWKLTIQFIIPLVIAKMSRGLRSHACYYFQSRIQEQNHFRACDL